MVIAILADEWQKEEFLSGDPSSEGSLVWADSVRSLCIIEADLYMDLQFRMDKERISKLKQILPKPVIVNAVVHTLMDIREPFIRLNAWPTMLRNHFKEICAPPQYETGPLITLLGQLGWNLQFVPDVPGMITPRIVSMIINEAWYAFGEGVGSKEEIDKVMKMGTDYPSGPFEWGEKIGLENVVDLLSALARLDPRYTIAPALSGLKTDDAIHFKY